MTFYLKYRPQTIQDLDLKSVRESLSKIVKNDELPHAFLFSGPKGTGKTSAARILAKVINCEDKSDPGVPCNKCDMCKSIIKGENIDVIEMDAASHRGIDDIRLLRDAVKLSPARAEKKVYIIDEAHMLTTEAANALLKTLEEPPEHVVFILATTNPEKIIGTVRSRTTIVRFQKASYEEIINSLKKVAKGENLKIDDDALGLIAEASDGSFRDAQKNLEILSKELEKLTASSIRNYLYGKEEYDVDTFIELLVEKDTPKLLEIIDELSSTTSIEHYLGKLISRLRKILLAKYNNNQQNTIKKLSIDDLSVLIKLFSNAKSSLASSSIEQLPFELAVIDWDQISGAEVSSEIGNGGDQGSGGGNTTHEDKKNGKNQSRKKTKAKTISNSSNGVNKTINGKISRKKKLSISNGVDENIWANILTQVRPVNASTEALLRAAKPIEYDGKTLNIGVYYKFHKEKLEGTPHRDLLEDVLEEVFGSDVRVRCTLTEPPAQPKPEPKEEVVLTDSDDEDIIKVAEEIFGT